MIWKDIWGETLPKFINNFNERMSRIFTNITEKNCKFNQLEIPFLATEPEPIPDKVIIFGIVDGTNKIKAKFPDGTTGTFTLT